jgi:hypothetical protein
LPVYPIDAETNKSLEIEVLFENWRLYTKNNELLKT